MKKYLFSIIFVLMSCIINAQSTIDSLCQSRYRGNNNRWRFQMIVEDDGMLQTYKDSTKILGMRYGYPKKALFGWYDIDIPSPVQKTISGKRLNNRSFMIGVKPDIYSIGGEKVYISAEGCFNQGVPCCEWVFRFYWNNNQSSTEITGKQKDTLLKIANYNDGVLDGQYIIIHKNDTLYSSVFTNGTGYYKDFYPDGTLWIEGHIKNGYRQGEWKNYETQDGESTHLHPHTNLK